MMILSIICRKTTSRVQSKDEYKNAPKGAFLYLVYESYNTTIIPIEN